jgi:hypothetical protein
VLGQVVTANLELEALAAEPAYIIPAGDDKGAGGQHANTMRCRKNGSTCTMQISGM